MENRLVIDECVPEAFEAFMVRLKQNNELVQKSHKPATESVPQERYSFLSSYEYISIVYETKSGALIITAPQHICALLKDEFAISKKSLPEKDFLPAISKSKEPVKKPPEPKENRPEQKNLQHKQKQSKQEQRISKPQIEIQQQKEKQQQKQQPAQKAAHEAKESSAEAKNAAQNRKAVQDKKKAEAKKAAAAAENKKMREAEKKLKKLLPSAFEFLSEQSRIDLMIGMMDIGNESVRLSDYSTLLVPPYRGLERFIFDLQNAKGIEVRMIGQAFEKSDGRYNLKLGYRKRIGSIVYNEVLSALYIEYFEKRNFYAHSDITGDLLSRVITDKETVKSIFAGLVALLEYNTKKLKEINFLQASQNVTAN